MAGAEPGEARGHFTRRARGQRSAARGGDLFRGRDVALGRIREWLTAGDPHGQALVLTGKPGAGKSAVLARAALGVEAGYGGPGLAFHARAATIGDFLTALAYLTGIDRPASADELITALDGLPGQSPVPVVLDALDEAASDRDRRQITEALAELAVLPGLRVAVATRTMAAGDPFALGGLLPALGVTARDDHNLIDLDSDAYFDLEGLRQFAAALLAQDGMDRPGPPGAAWTQYRARNPVCDRLAAVIAERAGRNFLVAAMAAVPLSTARTMTDPAAKGFDPAGIPSGIGKALSKYLDRLPDQRQERDRELLTALAYARGTGLDDPDWLAFAAALGYDARVADLDALRRSPAADYLLQTTTTERGARPVSRLFHQALTDELLVPRHRPSDESALLDMLLGQAEHTGWQDRYLREHAAEHAAAADRLDQLLEDPLYLITVDPARLMPYLDTARSGPARTADGTPVEEPLRGHRGGVNAVAAGALPDGDPVIISGGIDGTVRVWQTADSVPTGKLVRGHRGGVNAVAAGALPDGTPVIISGGGDGTVRVWRTADRAPVGEPLRGHRGGVNAVAAGALPDGDPVIISGGDDGTVRVWRTADGAPVEEPLRGHRGGVNAVAAGALPDGTPVIISGNRWDGTVQVWRLADGTPLGEPLHGHRGAVGAVAAGALPDGDPVIISGDEDGTVRVWRTADSAPVGEPLRGHDGAVGAVAAGALPDGDPVIISGDEDGTVRVWRTADSAPVGEPLRGHRGAVGAVAAGALPDGDPVIISGDEDGTVRVWRTADSAPVGKPLRGHRGAVGAVATAALPDGDPVIISGDEDGTVRVWRTADSAPVGKPLRGHRGAVSAVATGALPDGTPVIISGDRWDGTVQVWRTADSAPVGRPLRGHDGGVNAVAAGALPDGTPVIISGGDDGTVRVWRTADGVPVVPPLDLSASVNAVAAHGNVIVTAAGADLTAHQPALPSPVR